MPDLLQRGADMLGRLFKSSASHIVTYKRGQLTCVWAVTVGQSVWAGVVGDVAETWTTRDFVGQTSELIAAGISMPPIDGDLVIDSVSAVAVTYELAKGSNGQVFRFSDDSEARVRVHTVELFRD